ncbi:MAG TPA: hypothetical protein VGO93_00045 [Candidatus Xenobia bacterium]|jgi:hypothetical protein
MGNRLFGLLDVATSGLQEVVESPEFDQLLGAGAGLANRAMSGADGEQARIEASMAQLRTGPGTQQPASPPPATADDGKKTLSERAAAKEMGAAVSMLRFGMGKMSAALEIDTARRARGCRYQTVDSGAQGRG